eukprot:TRINITY_DN25985_c0_g1_i1.p1 TRINITY_DN25985_c0_g1~~TRINITY_DN25985_c0_g1_i1.p1  ORF type:complete len:107 (-),score=12.85 TRINITY_DN25985_c0_g1_i1:57-377(-)
MSKLAESAQSKIQDPRFPSMWQRNIATKKTNTVQWGYFLQICTFVLFVMSMYSLLLSKLLPKTGMEILDAIQQDRYYCLLVPVTLLPVSFLFVLLNWMSMKFFRHN